jgi:hypothetical protein
MKKLLPFLLLAVLLLIPQFFLSSYIAIVCCWFAVGMFFALGNSGRKMFGKVLLAQLLVGAVLYFTVGSSHMFYLEAALADVSSLALPAIWIVFNCLNAAFCAMGGAALIHMLNPPRVAS